MAKKFVRIQSTKNITVTPGLQHQDVTNKDAHIPDRLKIAAEWPRAMVDIKAGVGLYPAYVAEWNTVKSLAKDKILTIGEFVDDADDETKAKKEKLDKTLEDIEEKTKKIKSFNLNDIAGE